jgi:hypothetical protein
MSIEILREDDEILSVRIDGEKLEIKDHMEFISPKSLLLGKKTDELPIGLRISIHDKIEDTITNFDKISFTISRIGYNTVEINFDDSENRKHWKSNIEFKKWMEAKRDFIVEAYEEINYVKLIDYKNYGDYIKLIYSKIINCANLNDIFEIVYQIKQEIDIITELSCYDDKFPKIEQINNEKEFTLKILIPMIRKLKFFNVVYNHGQREFGKDILFSRITEFDETEHWGALVKYGNISGEVSSDIDYIINQLDDSFKMPFYNVYTKRNEKISKLLVAISGRFTNNAIEKICEKIEISAIRNNLVFIDGAKIETIAEKFRK